MTAAQEPDQEPDRELQQVKQGSDDPLGFQHFQPPFSPVDVSAVELLWL